MSWSHVDPSLQAQDPRNFADAAAPVPDDVRWDATGVLIFVTSLLGLGGNGLLVLVRVLSG
jgi:hypothetical protein